jgi:hypothetical protein
VLGSGVEVGSEVAVKAGIVAEGDGAIVLVNSGEGVAATTVGMQALNANPRKMSKIGLANMVNRYTPYHDLGTRVKGFRIPSRISQVTIHMTCPQIMKSN